MCAWLLVACGARTELPSPYDPCALAPSTQKAIAPPASGPDLTAGAALVVANGSALFHTGETDGTPTNGVVDQVPIVQGGPRDDRLTSFPANGEYGFGSPLVTDGQYVYFLAGSGPQGGFQRVIAAPLNGASPARTLDNPAHATPYFISGLAAAGDRGVSWVLYHWTFGGSSVLAHWDGASTRSVATFDKDQDATVGDSLAANATTMFVLTRKALVAVALDGSTQKPLQSFAGGAGTQILGLNAQAIFYSVDGTSIVRHDLASGAETIIAGRVALLSWSVHHHGWADEDWLYFVTGDTVKGNDQGRELRRVSVSDGQMEVMWDAHDRPPTGVVATDACNVYWLTARAPWNDAGASRNGPCILMVQRK